jgi:class 3 adenylate cyclase/tetratricopeptide (TPR) repeat protein
MMTTSQVPAVDHEMRADNATNPGHDGIDASKQAEALLAMGEPLLAYNALERALADRPADLRLRQLKGLALARSGALDRAHQTLDALRQEGHADGETLGLLARTHKDLGISLDDEQQRQNHLHEAFQIYESGYRESRRQDNIADAYYTGINAATTAYLCGNIEVARGIAVEVETCCEEALRHCEGEDTYWLHATFAEAALILGDGDKARRCYARAAGLAGNRFGNLSSTRHQARLLLDYAGESMQWLDEVITVPPILVYTGHMIDEPGRSQSRFQPEMEPAVRDQILAVFESLRPLAVYGSAAGGSDILCLECAEQFGSELHIILPCPVDQFRETSVSVRDDGNWVERFDRLLESAKDVQVVSEMPPKGGASMYEYANLIVTGLARLRASFLETALHGVAAWDGNEAPDSGGTGSVVELWKEVGVDFRHINIDAAASRAGPPGTPQPASPEPGMLSYSVEAMLFSDAVGYSRLTERQIPRFIEHYLGAIARLNEQTDHKAVHIETAGDGMYMVFDGPEAAGRYALELRDVIGKTDWQRLGLPENLGIRIGLHCGPVFVGTDPITRQPLYTGTHTSRTSRIEPITPPGHVYASSAFAAVASARGVDTLRFSYIGRTRLAKDYGVLPLYHVRRAKRD